MVKACFWSLLSLGSGMLLTDHVEGQKSACWRKVSRRTGLMLEQNPGAGIGEIEAFDRVLKDGFFKVDCIKDSMYIHGDKFGGNKHEYRLADTQNVSIVHYNAHVAKEDREAITPTVCFNFCRTIPDMGYFGILNGRDCYCEPHYSAMASDSSACDSVCDGDNTQMCGGKSKSSIWAMHMCNDGAQVLGTAAFEANTVAGNLLTLIKDSKAAAKGKQDLAAKLQKAFGQAGDPDAGRLMQAAKGSAGDLQHLMEDADEEYNAFKKVIDSAVELSGLKLSSAKATTILDNIDSAKAAKFTEFDVAKKGDEIVKQLNELTPKANATFAKLHAEYLHSSPYVVAKGEKEDRGDQYYPAMYFVDKEFDEVPMTCTGEAVGEPLFQKNYHGCAAACDAHNEDCVGYSFFPTSSKGQNLCFLFSSFKTGQYYTGCDAGPPKKTVPKFLQKSNVTATQEKAPFETEPTHPVCVAKLSKYSGTTLKPDPEGKCKQCLRELTKANRCYE